jgi:hypothetical protein
MIYGMSRELREAPERALDSRGRPRFGSYAGGLERVELPAVSRLTRLRQRKRWLYVALASEELYVAFAAIDLGYASNAFFFAYDARARAMLARASVIGTPRMVTLDDALPRAGRLEVRHRALSASARVTRANIDLDVRTPRTTLEAALARPGAPPPITAIAELKGGVQITEKAALLGCRGRLRHEGRTREIDALGGYDFSHGLLERHTAWKWAFLLGHTRGGERVAVNLVSGFVGEGECALWTDGGVFPLGEGRFDFDRADPLEPWSVETSDGARLRFAPGAAHREEKNLGVRAARRRVVGRGPVRRQGARDRGRARGGGGSGGGVVGPVSGVRSRTRGTPASRGTSRAR